MGPAPNKTETERGKGDCVVMHLASVECKYKSRVVYPALSSLYHRNIVKASQIPVKPENN